MEDPALEPRGSVRTATGLSVAALEEVAQVADLVEEVAQAADQITDQVEEAAQAADQVEEMALEVKI